MIVDGPPTVAVRITRKIRVTTRWAMNASQFGFKLDEFLYSEV